VGRTYVHKNLYTSSYERTLQLFKTRHLAKETDQGTTLNQLDKLVMKKGISWILAQVIIKFYILFRPPYSYVYFCPAAVISSFSYLRFHFHSSSFVLSSFLRAFAKLRLSAWNNSAPTEGLFMKCGVWQFLETRPKIRVLLKSDQDNRHFIWRPMRMYENTSMNASQVEKFLGESFREIKNTHFIFCNALRPSTWKTSTPVNGFSWSL
jgi:hypothetical protein